MALALGVWTIIFQGPCLPKLLKGSCEPHRYRSSPESPSISKPKGFPSYRGPPLQSSTPLRSPWSAAPNLLVPCGLLDTSTVKMPKVFHRDSRACAAGATIWIQAQLTLSAWQFVGLQQSRTTPSRVGALPLNFCLCLEPNLIAARR